MREMEHVVEPVAVGSAEIVRQAISQVETVAAQDDDRLVSASRLPKLDFQLAWNPFLLWKFAVEKRRPLAFRRPSAPGLFEVLAGRIFETDTRTARDSNKSPPDRLQLRGRIGVRVPLQRFNQRADGGAERKRIPHAFAVRSFLASGRVVQPRHVERLQNRRQASEVPQKISDLFAKSVRVDRIGRVLPVSFLQLRENAAGLAEQTRCQKLDVLRIPGQPVG